MKKILMAAAMFASTISSAHAAEFVQTDTDGLLAGMKGFDSRLGKLVRVTYEITFSKAREWVILGNVPTNAKIPFSYVVNGTANVSYYNQAINGYSRLSFGIFGEGSGVKDFSDPKTTPSISVGISGRAIFDLDPLSFVDATRNIVFDAYDPGYYEATDTDFRIGNGYSAIQAGGSCGGYRVGEDSCGFAGSKLTYSYIPTSNAAVPEPATWALMILGFGAVGYAMRRRQKVAVRFA